MLDSMGVQELEQYTGRDEMPSGFNTFWDEELTKVNDVPLDYELTLKPFDLSFAECFDLTFTSMDSSQIYAKLIFPKNMKASPVILKFHGYQGKSADWSEAFKYVAEGVAVVMMDVRGQAGKSEDFSQVKGNTVKGHIVRGMLEGPSHLFYRQVYLDIGLLGKIIGQLPQTKGCPLISFGESQGGALALIAGAILPEVKRVFAIYPFLSDFRRVLALKYEAEAYDDLYRHFKFTDPFHRQAEQVFETLGYIDVKNFASLIKGDVTMICGLLDDVCPPSTQFAIYNRLTAVKEMLIMPEYGHEALNVDCQDLLFSWATGKKLC